MNAICSQRTGAGLGVAQSYRVRANCSWRVSSSLHDANPGGIDLLASVQPACLPALFLHLLKGMQKNETNRGNPCA